MRQQSDAIGKVISLEQTQAFSFPYSLLYRDRAVKAPSKPIFLHSHEQYEIQYVVSGEIVYACEEASKACKQHTLIVTPPHFPHATYASNGQTAEMIYISTPMTELLSNVDHMVLNLSDYPHAMLCLRRIVLESIEENTHYEFVIAAEIVRLYNIISSIKNGEKYVKVYPDKIEDLVYSRKVKLVNKIKSYIEETIADTQISINDIARHFYVSRQHMTRLFKEIEDINPMEYKTKIRIEQAKKQLSLSDSSIKEVAQTLGFSDVQYFHKSFKKYTGMTPLQYKQEYAVQESISH